MQFFLKLNGQNLTIYEGHVAARRMEAYGINTMEDHAPNSTKPGTYYEEYKCRSQRLAYEDGIVIFSGLVEDGKGAYVPTIIATEPRRNFPRAEKEFLEAYPQYSVLEG